MSEGHSPSEGYAASLRQMADYQFVDFDELRAAADFITKQAARIGAEERLRAHKGVLDSLTDEQLKALAEMPEPAVMCGKKPYVR